MAMTQPPASSPPVRDPGDTTGGPGSAGDYPTRAHPSGNRSGDARQPEDRPPGSRTLDLRTTHERIPAERAGEASPDLIVLCGLPFAGKSTLARDLAARLGMRHVEVDAIVREQGGTFGPDPLPRAAWVTAYREGHRRLGHLLAGGTPAVWDAVSFRWSHREALRRLATRQGRTSHLVWVSPPGVEIARRRAENRLVPRRGDVPEAEFAGVAAGFQAPRPDEAATRYDPAMMTLDDLITILTEPGDRDVPGDAAAIPLARQLAPGHRSLASHHGPPDPIDARSPVFPHPGPERR